MKTQPTIRTTVRLPPALMAQVKRKARAESRSVTELVTEGLKLVLSSDGGKKQDFVMPPMSTASGGVVPGIDLTRTSAILDLLDEDLPLVKRR